MDTGTGDQLEEGGRAAIFSLLNLGLDTQLMTAKVNGRTQTGPRGTWLQLLLFGHPGKEPFVGTVFVINL